MNASTVVVEFYVDDGGVFPVEPVVGVAFLVEDESHPVTDLEARFADWRFTCTPL